jgi:ferredoxin
MFGSRKGEIKMNNCVIYFSGTGNSLKIAKDIASKIGDCETVSISEIIKTGLKLKYERIGFAFPVYVWGIPNIIRRFVNNFKTDLTGAYLFTIINYRGDPGDALFSFSNILKLKGLHLNYGIGVAMPGNHIGYYDSDSEDNIESKNNNYLNQFETIALNILDKKTITLKSRSLIDNFLKTGLLNKILIKQFTKWDNKFTITEKCDACGICVKICPVENIKIINSKPVWNHNCEQCLACLHWCPKVAIEYGKKSKGRKRYHHQSITLKEMLTRK